MNKPLLPFQLFLSVPHDVLSGERLLPLTGKDPSHAILQYLFGESELLLFSLEPSGSIAVETGEELRVSVKLLDEFLNMVGAEHEMGSVEPKMMCEEVPRIEGLFEFGRELSRNLPQQFFDDVAQGKGERVGKSLFDPGSSNHVPTGKVSHGKDNAQAPVEDFTVIVGETEACIHLAHEVIRRLVTDDHVVLLFHAPNVRLQRLAEAAGQSAASRGWAVPSSRRMAVMVHEHADPSEQERHKHLGLLHVCFICWAKESNAFGLIRLGRSNQKESRCEREQCTEPGWDFEEYPPRQE